LSEVKNPSKENISLNDPSLRSRMEDGAGGALNRGCESMKADVKQKQLTLDTIAKQIARCRVCRRGKVGLPVPGEGNSDADIVFIGEAPGKTEAATGRPFIGRSGKLLRKLIVSAGLKEQDVYITSPVKYLPKHVTPTPAEVAHGRKHLMEQFAVIEPKIVVLLGRVAALGVLQEKVEVAKMRGRLIEKEGIHYFLTYHPAAALYSQKLITDLKKDFRTIKALAKKMKKLPTRGSSGKSQRAR
jgi:uracil-DNA glycosylase